MEALTDPIEDLYGQAHALMWATLERFAADPSPGTWRRLERYEQVAGALNFASNQALFADHC